MEKYEENKNGGKRWKINSEQVVPSKTFKTSFLINIFSSSMKPGSPCVCGNKNRQQSKSSFTHSELAAAEIQKLSRHENKWMLDMYLNTQSVETICVENKGKTFF